MEQEDYSGSGLYRPRTEAENQSSDGMAPDKCRPVGGMNGSQLDGGAVTVSVNSVAGGEEAPAAVEAEVKVAERVCEKRKRGRPPRGQARQPPAKKRMEEEDVCFICFDGGSLVLCDRRGCPKAYHPACVKRDEAFFRSRAKWNCGWHICSRCHKAAHYFCYTCTYSLCKGCTKDADYLCVRENKGFCATCMRTIMMIENIDQGNKDMVQVDFDDKSSWEYLFKVYWSLLKGNLSLTLDELTQAQNPWKAAATVAGKTKSLDIHHGGNDSKGSISDSISGHLQASNFERRIKEQPLLHSKGDSLGTDKSVRDNGNISAESKEWASKELLELVAYMRDGDTSVLSQFDVQALLLDYIQRNNLRDPRQKSHVICDLRLRNLFGKPRVGHFEMLKLLEFHFITKEDSGQDVLQGNTVDAVMSKVEHDGNNDNLQSGKHKKHKTRRKGNERGQQTNLDEYAAINVHNIKLIYLHQNLMESLILDNGNFHDKVVGSFVRIRISSGDQNQDIYRLVQVVGTSKVSLPYKIGERTVDSKLEILNLDKKETISINEVSNQEFSEVECERLRQTMKCGLVKRLTVGQVQDKAMALQEVRLNDWLETEIMRLSNLRDRASEKGHKKELRECIQKLELLKTPEERERRLHEIPEVHADPNMDPNREADEDPGVISNIKQDGLVKSRYSRLSENGMEPISSRNSDTSDHSGGGVWKKSTTCDQITSISSPLCLDEGAPNRVVERVNETLWKEGKDACSSNTIEKSGNQVDSSGIVIGGWNDQIGSETSIATLSTVNTPSAYGTETEMLWHYRDPNGNIQGPFCMLQLRKWSTTGYFPPDMRVWSINDEEGDSLFLSDVLNGKFRKALPMQYISSLFQEVECASDSSLDNGDGKHSVSNTEDFQIESSSQCWDPLNVKSSYPDQPQGHQVHSPVPSLAFSEPSHETSLHQARGHGGQSWNNSPNHGNKSSHGNVVYNNNWDANSGFATLSKSTGSSEQNLGIEFANIPSPTTRTSNGDVEGQTTKDQPSNAFVQDLNIQNLPSPTSQPSEEDEKADSSIQNMPSPLPKPTDGEEKHQATENKQSPSSNLPVQDSGLTWSCASSLTVGCGTQLPETADRWGGSPAHAKPSVEEWDSGLVSLSSLKPTEVAPDHAAATPISKMGELTPSPYPASSWQAMVTEPIEFSTLAEESVSDLLAEVDAMESEGGLPSPTSVNRGEDLFHDSKTECFTSLGGLIPPIESVKSEVGKIQLSRELTVTEEELGASSEVNVLDLDAVKRSGGQSSTSMEVEVETKPIDVPVNQSKVGSKSQLPAPSPRSRDMVDTDTPPRSRTKPIDTRGGGGTTQETTNVRPGTNQGTNRGNANTNRATSAGFVGRESHPKYGGERSIGPRDRAFQSRDSGYSRGRPSWSRQSSFGGGGGSSSSSGSGVGSYSRPPHRGQRICKFYESGRCKKGAFCDYLHP